MPTFSCPNCRTLLAVEEDTEGAGPCPICGTMLEIITEETRRSRQRKATGWMIGLACALVLIIAGAYAAQQAGDIRTMQALSGVAFLVIMALGRSVWRTWQDSRAQDRPQGETKADER